MKHNSSFPISSVLVKPVSADCNLSCTYCFYLSKASLYPEVEVHRMDDEVLMKLMAQIFSIPSETISFCWQGGEPTLAGIDFYRRALRYQHMFKSSFQIVENSLQTNGTLIDDDWARFLSRYDFLVGISLDGPREVHDRYRRNRGGLGSYESVIRCIDTLRRYSVKFNILTVVNNLNVRDPKGLYRFMVDMGFKYLQFIPCVEKDHDGRIADYSITPEDYGRFLCELFDEWFNDGNPETYVRDFEDLLISYVLGDTPSCVFGHRCGRYIVVEYNGDVYPCDFYVDRRWLLGNIMEDNLEDIVTSEKFIEFASMKDKLRELCKDCIWLRYCNTGCPRHWEVRNYSENYLCKSYRMFFEHSHDKFVLLKNSIESSGSIR
ncbi:MAG: anaerobic sulfatase maturase [Candidatus Bathyarchaeia archaeon]|nr:anaerobic sulfatase maturase [Candidatus Bathyarchaeota archaeon]